MEQIITTENYNSEFIPEFQLTFYRNSQEVFVEKELFRGNSKGLGKMPMDINDLKNLSECYYNIKDERKGFFKGLIPDNMIYCDNLKIVWLVSAERKNIFFENREFVYSYIIPNLIFKWEKDTLYVRAILEKDFNRKLKFIDTLLYKAPFPNIYSAGNVCMGNVKDCPSHYLDEMIEYYTKAFFESEFNRCHDTVVQGNINEVWNIAGKSICFPEDRLIKANQTIKQFIHR